MILFAANVELEVYLLKVINGTQVQYFLFYRTMSPHGSHVHKIHETLELKYSCFCDLQDAFYPRKSLHMTLHW